MIHRGCVTDATSLIRASPKHLRKMRSRSAKVKSVPAGDVTQIRLYTASDGNYVVLADGSHADLKVPSGAQSGIKVQGPFGIHSCKRETVDLEFNGPHSIEYHATGTGEYILRPVIRASLPG